MASPICHWRTVTGVRFTALEDTLSCDVQAFAPPSENGINRVDFAISVNGVLEETRSVTQPTLRFPNYSDAVSPLPGVSSGMAPIFAYGTTISADDFDAGTITVVATAYTNAAHSLVVPLSSHTSTLTIYNDGDEVDRRPCQNTIYVSGGSGDDGNDGSEGAPVQTLSQAVAMVRDGSEVGGGRIIITDGTAIELQATSGITCTGHWWLTIECADEVKIIGAFPFFVTGGAGAGNTVNVRFKGTGGANKARFIGQPGAIDVGAVHTRIWIDGMGHSSNFYQGAGTMSIRFVEPDETGSVSDAFFNMTGGSTWERYLSCSSVDGWVAGVVSWTLVHDVLFQDVWGSVLATGMSNCGSCSVLSKHSYSGHPDILGLVGLVHAWTVLDNGDGFMRIQSNGALTHAPFSEVVDLEESMTEIVDNGIFAIKTTGFTGAGNTGHWKVIGTGTTAGKAYVDVRNSDFTAGNMPASARIDTVWGDDGTVPGESIDIHPDLLPINFGSNLSNIVHCHLAFIDTREKLGMFFSTPGGSGLGLTRGAFFDIALCNPDAAQLSPIYSLLGGASMTDCVMAHCSLGTQLLNIGTCTNCLFTDLVGYSLSLPTNGSSGNVVSHVHNMGGNVGAVGTSGDVWEAWPGESPYDYEPDDAHKNNSSGLFSIPTDWYWPDSRSGSRGCLLAVGTQDWAADGGYEPPEPPEPSDPAPQKGLSAWF